MGDDFNVNPNDGCSADCTSITLGYECPDPGFACTEICGDGLDLGNYKGDDGNPFPNDGCSDICEPEVSGFTGVLKPFPSTCTEICGDGMNFGFYEGDDANTNDNDGGSSTCEVEEGYCGDKESCDEIGGDGINPGGTHECDDGNVLTGDGCDFRCRINPYFDGGATYPSQCYEKGDGVDYYFWPCEDGNSVNGDGCDNSCNVELSYQGHEGDPLTVDVCKEIGGDGLDYFNYHGDDGNYNSGDGCSVLGLPEVGYLCTGGDNTTPDSGPEICGDGLNYGWYECDDGNLINGDGCNDLGIIEDHWRCYDGDPTRKDTCEEKGGDGVDLEINACEDSNVFEWDGCNKYCNIEEGWTCSGGDISGPDTCSEHYGDGCRVGSEECDDANLIDGDGCSSTMQVETGYECTGGNLTTSTDDFGTVDNVTSAYTCDCVTTAQDTGIEIGGDGLNVGVWEGDDGNNRDYDGCDSTCFIETGWTGTGGSNTTADTCVMQPRPVVNSVTISEDHSKLTVVFDQAMILYIGWTKDDFKIYITGYQEPYRLTWTLRDSTNLLVTGSDTYIFDLDITDQMLGHGHEKVHILFLNDEYFRSESTTLKLIDKDWHRYTDTTYQYASRDANQGGFQFIQIITWGSFAIMVIVVILYGYKYFNSMTPLWMIISSLQLLHLHCNMYLYIPSCLLDFYIDVGKVSFLTLPALRASLTPIKDEGLTIRFNDLGWDSPAFLANAIGVILSLIFLIPLIPLKWMKNKPYRNERVVEIIRRYWDQTLVVMLLLTFLPLWFAGVINFTDLNINKSKILYVSSFLTIYATMSLGMVWAFFIYLGVHTYTRTKSERISIEMGTQRPQLSEGSTGPHITSTVIIDKFLEDIDIRKAPASFHYAIGILRKVVWCFVLVYMKKEEIGSLLVLTFMNALYLYWMMFVRPYRTNLNNRIGIFVEGGTLLCTLGIFPYIRGWETKVIFEDFAKYQVAIIIIMFLVVPILILADAYHNKPWRKQKSIFKKKAKKLKRVNQNQEEQPPEEAEGEGEGESDQEKPLEEEKQPEEKPKTPKPEVSKSEDESSEGEESEESSQHESSPKAGTPKKPEESSISVEHADVYLDEAPKDDVSVEIISADVNIRAHVQENFDQGAIRTESGGLEPRKLQKY